MTEEEAREHYPGAARWVYLMDRMNEATGMLDEIREFGLSPEEFVANQIALNGERPTATPDEARKSREILEQLTHPDALRYVRAKFGAV